jgi:hypothetical protein
MNLDDDTVSGATPERLCFIKHKGQAIFLIDFSHCKGKEILLLLDQVRADVARNAPGSVLTLADFSGAQVDKAVATKIKEVLVLDRPYVKKSAWVGTDSLRTCSTRTLKAFLNGRFLPLRREKRRWTGW